MISRLAFSCISRTLAVITLTATNVAKTGRMCTLTMRESREEAGVIIFEDGSFKKDLKKGFLLAIHQELPDAPRSPFYLNLRKKGTKGGVLTRADFVVMARSLKYLCDTAGIFDQQRPVVSIPAAGDPFLDHLLRFKTGATRFRLTKDESTGKRKFHLAEGDNRPWLDTALFDDLVASMMTKQLAIDAVRRGGGTVTDLVVFLNRSADAREKLARQGVRLHAAWEFEDFMEWALGRGYLTRKEYEAIVAYPGQLAAYKQSVGYNG